MKGLIDRACDMGIHFLALWLLCLSAADSKPQITKLFPVQEAIEYHQRTSNETKLDKFLGKLWATYNFVFRRPENTSNVEKILAKEAAVPDVDDDDWINYIQPLDHSEGLEPLELEDEEDKKTQVEFITPRPTDYPATIRRRLVDWLSLLLGIPYGVYSKLTRAIYSNGTVTNN